MIKLSLGCAQFGMNYGFTNERGKVDEDEVKKIIDYAIANDIKNFDTAQSYGNSEEVLGKFIKNYSGIKIMSKFSNNSNDIYVDKDINSWEMNFQNSLNKLNINKIDCFLIHNSIDLKKNGKEILEEWLISLIKRKLINRLGISIYSISDLNSICLDNYGLIQTPISLYDQRLVNNKTFEKITKKNISIFARSIFFQGLLLVNSDKWPTSISRKFKLHHSKFLHSLNKELRIEICLKFIKSCSFIDSSLIGITSLDELKEVVNVNKKIKLINESFSEYSWNLDSDLDPRLW